MQVVLEGLYMIKKCSVVAADIDGTLALKGENPLPKTTAAIIRLHNEGVLFGVASGRPLDHRVLDYAKKWNLGFDFDFAIGVNGGELYTLETGKVEKFYPLKKETIRDILSFLIPLDVNAIVYSDGYNRIYALKNDAFMEDSRQRNHSVVEIGGIDLLSSEETGKIEVHATKDKEAEILRLLKEHAGNEWICIKTFELYDHVTYEFLDPRVNKGLALQEYSKFKQIPLEEFMAFGDMENDIGLLREAGWGVCLINGSDATKAVAQAITEYSVEEDGVGKYLEMHWFNREEKDE